MSLHAMGWAFPMLTEAEQSTDRVWLPLNLVQHVVLGGEAITRNEPYPLHAVSWENATGRLMPFVQRADRDHLEVLVHNLDEEEATVNMRVWRLDHGRYRIRMGPTDGHPVFDRQGTLARYGRIPVTVPAHTTYRLRVDQVEPLPDIRQRPDLAVTAHDAFYNYDVSALTFQVHNIGNRPSGPFTVRVRVGNEILLEREMESLDAPTDLFPKRIGVKVRNLAPYERGPITIEIDPENRVDEITTANNVLDIVPFELPGHDTLR